MWTRRRAVTVIASSLAAGGCAAGGARPVAPLLVNLADQAPGSDTALLDAAADTASRVMVPVRINGQGPYDFVVDTGANRTVITSELAHSLLLPAAGTAQIHGIAGVEPSETAMIGLLEVGRVASRRIRAPILSRARLGADGLLGVDVLKNRRVAIDFLHNTLNISKVDDGPVRALQNVSGSRLRDDGAGEGAREVVVRARFRFGQLIIIDADIGGVPVTAFLDSGSQNTVGNLRLETELLDNGPARASQVSVVELVSATGQRAQGVLSAVPPLRLGGLSIGNLSAVFADLHIFKLWDLQDKPAILVGIDVMRHFELIELDFGGRQVRFQLPPGIRRAD